ncbi:DEAD/DEAH box helicase [Aciditerrimonas ferrireducens]|uniref:DEAD/DEAH box helicase n=1 Tax=Aciditerrimonas ferrireducens TaxID=667306 RepID=A0ABV6C241_9ACTN
MRRDRAFPFPLDPFQERALDALDRGASVLVSAPTGAGKTVVAEYAVDLARREGTRAFYTTPLKALSNQKFGQLRQRYGPEQVGLLTGDTTFQPDAPVVVMTTEVLRNMLFAGSPQLADLGLVVLDEVHFLQDPYRGSVWEEVIILSPPPVRLVCLSATVANAEELGAWLRSVRGAVEVVVEERRPVALRHHLAVAERGRGRIELLPVLKDGGLHPEAARFDHRVARFARQPGGLRRSRLAPPRRTELVEALAQREMLPAIVFIFSRAACEDAVAQCLSEGIRLTGPGERAEIRRRCEAATEGLPDDELAALGYGEWLAGLEEGLAAHHAGMIPAFREAVESCFADGLLGVVFATETLSLGINMPARTVVVERLTKVRESGRSALTSGEYAQLTGRAGRRGLDPVGHAVVPWGPQVLATDVARLATTPPPDLRSSFRPTYNLAANLVRRFSPAQARHVLDRSFAQWVDRRQHRALSERLQRTWALLEAWGYLDRAAWRLTPRGEMLARIYHESDLLVAEALACGCFGGLDAPALAAVASALVFAPRVARRRLRPAPPPEAARARLEELGQLAERLREDEALHRLPPTRLPDPGFAQAAAAWARGRPLERILERAELAPGDFVRTIRQLVDLLRQVALVAPEAEVADQAALAARALDRGVVASGVLGVTRLEEVEEPLGDPGPRFGTVPQAGPAGP